MCMYTCYIHICMCMHANVAAVLTCKDAKGVLLTHAHTCTYIYVHIYMYIWLLLINP